MKALVAVREKRTATYATYSLLAIVVNRPGRATSGAAPAGGALRTGPSKEPVEYREDIPWAFYLVNDDIKNHKSPLQVIADEKAK